MDRRDISKVLLGSVSGAALLSERAAAQSCVAPCYPQTNHEFDANVTIVNPEYPPYSVPRYGNNTQPGVTDCTSFIQAALKAAGLANTVAYLPGWFGRARVTSEIKIKNGRTGLAGDGPGQSIVFYEPSLHEVNVFSISGGLQFITITGITIASAVPYSGASNEFKAINIQGTTGTGNICEWHTYRDLFIDGFETPIQANGVFGSVFDNIFTLNGKHGIVAEQQTVNNRVVNSRLTGGGVSSYGVRVGDGVSAAEGWTIDNCLLYGFSTGVWGFGSSNSKVTNCFIDFFTQYGVMLQSGAAIAATNWDISSNYMAASGSTASSGIRCLSSVASSDARGNRIALNDILVYGGSHLSYGILVDGSQELSNRIIGNNCRASVYDCRITSGTGHIVEANRWLNLGFDSTVLVTYEGNHGTCLAPTRTRQASGANFVYHGHGAPTAGTYLRGDIAWETTPVANGSPGFMCVTSGSPGTWRAMANLSG